VRPLRWLQALSVAAYLAQPGGAGAAPPQDELAEFNASRAAQNEPPKSEVKLAWKGAQWKARKEWVWTRLSPDRPGDTPALRITVEPPAGVQVVSARTEPGAPWARTAGSALVFETASPRLVIAFRYRGGGGGGGAREREASLTVTIASPQGPFYWINAACGELGVGIGHKGGRRAGYLFAAAVCVETPEGALVHVAYSADAAWSDAEEGGLRASARGEGWRTIRLSRELLASGEARIAGRFRIGAKGGGPASENILVVTPRQTYATALEAAAGEAGTPTVAQASLTEGERQLALRDPAKAAEHFRASREADPGLLDSWFLELHALRALKRHDEERRVRQELLERHPELGSVPSLKERK
jgi:hypothetical protein